MSGFGNRIDVGVDYHWRTKRRIFAITVRLAAVALGLMIGAIASALHAQTKILYYSFGAKNNQPIPAECKASGAVLASELTLYPHPDQWTYIIACDDRAWTEMIYAARSEYGALIFGATNPDNHTTLLRGTTLRGEGDKRMTADHLVSHELAHIFLHSYDERRVDALAQEWMEKRKGPTTPALHFISAINP